MKKTLKRILLASGFVLGAGLVGTSFYLAKHDTSYALYTAVRIGGLLTLTGIAGCGMRPLLNDLYENDKNIN